MRGLLALAPALALACFVGGGVSARQAPPPSQTGRLWLDARYGVDPLALQPTGHRVLRVQNETGGFPMIELISDAAGQARVRVVEPDFIGPARVLEDTIDPNLFAQAWAEAMAPLAGDGRACPFGANVVAADSTRVFKPAQSDSACSEANAYLGLRLYSIALSGLPYCREIVGQHRRNAQMTLRLCTSLGGDRTTALALMNETEAWEAEQRDNSTLFWDLPAVPADPKEAERQYSEFAREIALRWVGPDATFRMTGFRPVKGPQDLRKAWPRLAPKSPRVSRETIEGISSTRATVRGHLWFADDGPFCGARFQIAPYVQTWAKVAGEWRVVDWTVEAFRKGGLVDRRQDCRP